MPSTLAPLPTSTLNTLLTAQLAVAWAGEAGEEPRLGWWRTDLASEFGGEDLLRRLTPRTWQWAVLQSLREAARREDARLRARLHDPDQLLTLFRLGPELDERLDQHLLDHKHAGKSPTEALPGLALVFTPHWRAADFAAWVSAHPTVPTTPTPAGRRLNANPPASPERRIEQLVGALTPLSDAYPMPHYRVAR
jgi:hypothetical protein